LENINVPVPTMACHYKVLKRVAAREHKTTDAQASLDAAPAKKEAIMRKNP